MTTYTIHLTPDVDRYGTIAKRWPEKISITGSLEQIAHFLLHGVYEAGCTDLLIPCDEESERVEGLARDLWLRMYKDKTIRENGEVF